MTNGAIGTWRLPQRLAYVVAHAQPFVTCGPSAASAARSHAIARALTTRGHDVIIFLNPGSPWDNAGFEPDMPVVLDRRIDGVRYICLPLPPQAGATQTRQIQARAKALTDAFYAFRPAAVLATSGWMTAEPARRAAGRVNTAFFYEHRAFSHVAEQKRETGAISPAAEAEIATAARATFTPSRSMFAELTRLDVPETNLHVVPNGMSRPGRIDKFVTRARLGCKAKYLLGNIGAHPHLDTPEDVVDLIARLRSGAGQAALDVDALIVGPLSKGVAIDSATSSRQAQIAARAAELGIDGHVHLVAQPSDPAILSGYYTLCDAVILPRKSTPLATFPTPPEPFAAGALSVPVFMTHLPPLTEIAAELHGSLFEEGDIAGLARMVHDALTKGHAATIEPLDPALDWVQRVRPISEQLNAVAQAEQARNAQLFVGFAPDTAPSQAPTPVAAGLPSRFDLNILPSVALNSELEGTTEVRIGPKCASPGPAGRVTWASRSDLLDMLAKRPPGNFIIDWAGLRAAPDAGEWTGLWSIDDMRLNRQIMDAVRIAMELGWRVRVMGPVHRSQAPLFRSIADVVEEVQTDADDAPTVYPATQGAA